MAAPSNLTSDVRRPVVSSTFDYTSKSRGTAGIDRNLLIVAMKLSTGTATVNEPVEVFDEADAQLKGGVGSESYFGVQWALAGARRTRQQHGGAPPRIFVCHIADPGGTPAVHRIAAVGTASESKDAILRVSGRTINVPIPSGTAAATAVTLIAAAVNAVADDLPVTASSAASNCDLTARHTGVIGNDIDVVVVQEPADLTLTASVQTAGSGTTDLTAPLAACLDKQYLAIVIGNHASADVTDLVTHMGNAWEATEKKFGHGFVAETGSLSTATTLASGANDEKVQLTAYTGCPNLPIEVAAAVAGMGLTKEQPSYNYDLTELPLYTPYTPGDAYIASEVETALAAGCTPITVSQNGKSIMQRLVTTKTTVNSVQFEDLLDLKNSKTLAHYALLIDRDVRLAMRGANLDDEFIDLVKDLVYAKLKDGERAGDLHNVDAHKEEIVAEVHPSITSRLLAVVPQAVVQSAHQVDFTQRMFIEAPA